MNRYLKSIGGVGLVALLGVTMVSGVVDAQTSSTPGAETSVTGEKTSKRDQFLSTLADNLGVSVETLQTAVGQTVDEVGFGPFGGRFHGFIKDRIDDRRERIIEHVDLSDGADFLGITEDELRAELLSGKTPLEIAEEHGKTQDEIRAFLIQQATERIDARLAESAETTGGADASSTTGA
jgi:hypothetical protein